MNEPELEQKFAPTEAQVEGFLSTINERLSPKIYQARRPFALTRTTYLDSVDLRYLHSEQSGVSRRLRLREYAATGSSGGIPAHATGISFLELKTTAATVRTKLRLPASPSLVAGLFSGEVGRASLLASAPRVEHGVADLLWHELAERAVRPQITTWYRRTSFTDGDKIRVTVDTDILFCLPGMREPPDGDIYPLGAVGKGPEYVVEVKSATQPPPWLIEALAGLGPSSGLSKYELAMAALARLPRRRRRAGISRYCRARRSNARGRRLPPAELVSGEPR